MDLPEFRARLEQAFAAVPNPGDDNLTDCDCYECHDLDEYFRGKSWHGHTVRDLRFHQDALYRLTVEALRYYLPAYILADLEDPTTADVISDSLISQFVPRLDQRAEALAHILSPEQRAVMLEYLAYCLEIEGEDFEARISHAMTLLRAAGSA